MIRHYRARVQSARRIATAQHLTLALALLGGSGCTVEDAQSDESSVQEERAEDDSAETAGRHKPRRDASTPPRRDAAVETPTSDAGTEEEPEQPAERDAGHTQPSHGDASTGAPQPSGDAGPAKDGGTDAGHPSTGGACLHTARDARDALLTSDAPVVTAVGNQQDVLLPKPVLDWMKEREWDEAHNGWHVIRTWDQGCRKSNATADACTSAKRLASQGLWRAQNQQGAPHEGLEFLAIHRHMIQHLREAFPSHPALFASFKHVPRSKADPENTMPWRNITWSANATTGLDILENIEKNLALFPTEDDLGHYIESSFRWTPERPNVARNQPGSGIHGALHGQWAVFGSPANLINQAIDLGNYNFWKLHGWIDDVWERYRKAKGLTESDPDYVQLMVEQCEEMEALRPSQRKKPMTGTPGTEPTNPQAESGFFAKSVRPALEATCSGCHSNEGGISGGVVLGGKDVSSAEIIESLVGKKASNDTFELVKAGSPQQSWLYLKASGGVTTVSCTRCDKTVMPPSGPGLTTAQLETLRQWIASGAKTD